MGKILKPVNLEEMAAKITEPTKEGEECRKLIEQAKKIEAAGDRWFSIEEAAQILGVSAQTLRNWEEQGRVKPTRTPKGHRRYTRKQINEIRKQEMKETEILLDLTSLSLKKTIDEMLEPFSDSEELVLSIRVGADRIKFSIDSVEGFGSSTKVFKIKE